MQHFQITHDNKIYECKKCNIKLEGMEVMRDHIKKIIVTKSSIIR